MENKKVEIYVCTHKKFDTTILKDCYKPLLCGATNFDETFGYLTDDTGENISSLNKYYAELTGQYWAWKNSDADIIGFCHYRRYFAKNVLLNEILDKEDIFSILGDFDIILPQMTHSRRNVVLGCFIGFVESGEGAQAKEYTKIRRIIENDCPEYLESFDKVIYGKRFYNNNMFITTKKRADHYFQWLFHILGELKNEINFSEYNSNNLRVLGYVSEILLSVYVDRHCLKVKEKFLLNMKLRSPHFQLVNRRFPLIGEVASKIINYGK